MIDKEDTLKDLEELNQSLNVVSRRFQINSNDKGSSLESLCDEKDIDVNFFVEILKVFSDSDYFPLKQLQSFPVSVILDYLQKTHLLYLNMVVPEIENLLGNIEKNKASAHLITYIKNYFIEFRKELGEHIRKEEKYLFPYAEELEKALFSPVVPVGLLSSFDVLKFEDGHDDHIEDGITEIRKFIVKFCDDAKEMLPFKIFLSKLSLLETDLRVHALVENKILIPMVFTLEQELQKKQLKK